jgi:hypothetical protein
MTRTVHDNQIIAYQGILDDVGWSEEYIMAWAQRNWYQRVGLDSLELYVDLHGHLVDLYHEQGWDYAYLSLRHHAMKLADIRVQAPSRLVCLVRIYVYLRDAHKSSFYSEKLQEKRNQDVKEDLESLKALGGGGGGACPKCGQPAHQGGVKNCHFKGLSDTEARKKMTAMWANISKLSAADWAKLHTSEE